MKKIIAVLVLVFAASFAALAQPRAIGGYLGMPAEGVYYQHLVNGGKQFIEVSAHSDLVSSVQRAFSLGCGFDYEFIFFSAPKSKGTWNLYAGPGIRGGIGCAGDDTHSPYFDIVGNFGFDFTFNCHVQLSAQIQPGAGICFNNSYNSETGTHDGPREAGPEFTRGLCGFIPTLKVAYAF